MANTALNFGPSGANTTRYYTFTGPVLPNADWCIGMWFRDLVAPAGVDYSIGVGTWNANNSLQMRIGSTGDVTFSFADPSGAGSVCDPFIVGWGTTPKDYLMIMQRRGSNLMAYVKAKGATVSGPNQQSAHGQTAALTATNWVIGSRQDHDTATMWKNPLGEAFILTGDSLTNAEITTLCAGAHISAVRPTRAVDLRLRTSLATEPDLSGNSHNATQHGSGFTTATEFFADNIGPDVTDVGDESLLNGETGRAVTGVRFGASQGDGKVYLSPTNNVADAGRVEQTVTSWSDTALAITVAADSLPRDTNVYLFVVNDDGESNATGYQVQIKKRVYVREKAIRLNRTLAADETGITAFVWRSEPSAAFPNPNQAIGSLIIDESGVTNWEIARGLLSEGDPVWIMAIKDASSAVISAMRVIPEFE